MTKQSAEKLEKSVTRLVRVNFLLHIPSHYDAKSGERWPLILFLHGAGERGEDLERVKVHGVPKIVEEREDFPFIVVSPQCPENTWWSPEDLVALLEEMVARYPVDEERLYLTGLSMGGYGTWSLALQQPGRFAAIAPICGGGNPHLVARIKHVPAWVFHGARDSVVPLQKSEEMVEALRACGGKVRFTIYPEADHDSWTETYDNPELYEWFLSHRQGNPRQ